MAPTKRPARNSKTSTVKRVRLDDDASSKKESAERGPVRHVMRTRSRGRAAVYYSPELSTSESSDSSDPSEYEEESSKKLRLSLIEDSADDDDGPRKPMPASTDKLLRASRRIAERAREVDLTDEEERGVEVVKPGPPRSVAINGKSPRELRAGRRRAEKAHHVDLTDEEEELAVNAEVDVQEKAPEGELGFDVDAEGETGAEEPITAVEEERQARSENVSPESDVFKKPVQLEDIDFSTGAAARYVEFMKRRGHAPSEIFNSSPAASGASHSPSSEGSESESESESDFDYIEYTDRLFAEANKDSYLVYRRDKTMDGLLSGQLRLIARVLNFIVRARASGIEVGDFEDLAAVEPERWGELVDAPEHAADFVVRTLLGLSIWEICVLSERAAALQGEMEELGVVI